MTRRSGTLLTLLCISFLTFFPWKAQAAGDYFNIVDESGQSVYITGWQVKEGDQCLTETNKRYEVVSVDGHTAKARFVGDVNLAQYTPQPENTVMNFLTRLFHFPGAAAQNKPKVAIYHTHSDESYVPTDGTQSILGAGGIYKVGDAFASALERNGVEAIHSMAKHDPHDDMAYQRSRRTVVALLKQHPDALFDVHRDAVPPEVYKTTINGQDVTKVQLVVGKYGPTGKQIEDYALQIKATADKQHPGLIKGIFFAKGGDYNQDLYPRSMLLEVGAHTNDRASAERGIALFADVVPTILGKTAAAANNEAGSLGFGGMASGLSGSAKSILWIISLLIVGSAAFLYLSTGSVKEARAKLKHLTTREFTNFFGPEPQHKREDDNTPDKQ